MTYRTIIPPLDREHVNVLILNSLGDIAESHRVQSWDVEISAGEFASRWRDTHGYTPTLRVRFLDGHPADYLLPRSWRDAP